MADLARELAGWRGRRLWLLGVGNPAQGDDGFGVRLAGALAPRLAGCAARAVDAGIAPERFVGRAAAEGCQALVFADAARFGAAPGAVLLADAAELRARPPGASTHRVPISVLAQYAEGLGLRAWLLGVQPETLDGPDLSPAVAGALRALTALLGDALAAPAGPPLVPPRAQRLHARTGETT
jgi:hydrogenase maturation protease